MPRVAAYDAYADWYEDYLTGPAADFAARAFGLTARLLGEGAGTCLDVACGTGAAAPTVRALGWSPIGIDLSLAQLRYASRRLPVVAADAAALPLPAGAAQAAICVLCHTDVPDYPAVVREVARVLRPGGRFVHVGVHPCFTGAFADRSDPGAIVIDPGYNVTHRRFDAWSPHGVRARVGAWHLSLAALLHALLDAGLALRDVEESGPGQGVPDVLGTAAVKPPA
jgi:SAM-dependent methyltransferase